MTDQQSPTHAKRQRNIILMLLLISIGPMIIAGWLYTSGRDWVASKSTNHGQLILPPMSLSAWKMKSVDTNAANSPGRKWVLMYFQPGACDTVCQKNIFKARQVHLAMGKEYDRVRRVFVTYPSPTLQATTQQIQKRYPKMFIWLTQSATVHNAAQGSPVKMSDLHGGAFLLADPNGNIMMRYPNNVKFRFMILDLKKLLKVSRIG